ncbi:MAG: hypothetical protein RL154_158 [Pseudomonadota bacterium]|jgi:hypothetical protein
MSASNGAMELGMSDNDIISSILQLKSSSFYKTMQSEKISTLWQDVYHTNYMNKIIYIKMQITAKAVIISFKEK